jgi:hypothetical protein
MKNILILAFVCFKAFAYAQIPNYIPSNGLVGWWPFNGSADDESGNNNNGSIFGATLTTDRLGSLNSAYAFDGNDDFISVPSLNNLSYKPITYSVWFRNEMPNLFPLTPGFKFKAIIGRNTAFISTCGVLGIFADENWSGGAFDNQATFWRGGGYSGDAPLSNTIIGLNAWIHLALTQEQNGNWKFYINGQLTNQGNYVDTQDYYDFFQIGGCNNQSTGNTFWQGKLDDIGIWNRALTEQEIFALYQGCQMSITTQPINQSVNLSTGNTSFNVVTNAINPSYQWQTNLGLGFQTLSNAGQYNGVNTANLSVSNLNTSNDNQTFRCIINDNGCVDTSDIATLTIIDDASVFEENSTSITISPNPISNDFSISGISNIVSLSLKDLSGKLIKAYDVQDKNYSISYITSGVYFLEVRDEIRAYNIKVVKE